MVTTGLVEVNEEDESSFADRDDRNDFHEPTQVHSFVGLVAGYWRFTAPNFLLESLTISKAESLRRLLGSRTRQDPITPYRGFSRIARMNADEEYEQYPRKVGVSPRRGRLPLRTIRSNPRKSAASSSGISRDSEIRRRRKPRQQTSWELSRSRNPSTRTSRAEPKILASGNRPIRSAGSLPHVLLEGLQPRLQPW